MENKHIQFGLLNVKTGEFQSGYINKQGKMKYKRQPFWKRWFNKKPIETKYVGVGTVPAEWSWIFSNTTHQCTYDVAVYKDVNSFTDEIYSVYFDLKGRRYFFNVDAFKEGKLIVEQ